MDDSAVELEDWSVDSGMDSGNSKDETPERKSDELTGVVAKSTENYDDEPDETLAERLIGLTEMFPEPVRKAVSKLTYNSYRGVKGLYAFSCAATWLFFSSSIILFAPVMVEVERAQMEQMQRSQQKQVLLGPGSAMPMPR
ncbi:LOW QUALITY PROTEIN: mitochondrial import receptor subunit TOM22 homolog [Ctenocephalides felis]|uniref:LOW QUALITY PROTEIN: mitochondrial import receptor subunit TOM22 homolog n=1 Tax=Ctenocephalides felis TaxID=7515 RepID=UPI000E6E1927|nr:LOW QUALITY PROTEIN: mitochondrial import receptor subunit TOM22 homolog [Ctenocephalides felis]